MSLEDLNNQLYSRDHSKDREHVDNLYEQNGEMENISRLEIDGEGWEPVVHHEKFSEKLAFWWAENRRKVTIGVIIVGILTGAGIFGYQWYKKFFSEGNTAVIIMGPEEVKSGEVASITIQVENTNRTALENVKVSLEYGSSFVPEVPYNGWQVNKEWAEIPVGALASGEKKQVKIAGKLFASKGSVVTFKALAKYNPQKISGVYEARAEKEVGVLSSPLTMEVRAPQELVAGQPLDYELVYKNESNQTLDNVRIKASFPEGFSFKSANPPTNTRDTWILGTFRPGDSGKIIVTGSLDGVWNEKKEVKFSLGYESGDGTFVAYNEGLALTRVIASPLSVRQRANDSTDLTANPGDILNYIIEYRNNSESGLREAIITTSFENPEFIDWENLDLPRGNFDENTGQVVWKASDIPELRTLAPGQGGMLNFAVPIIKDFSAVGVVKNKAIVTKTTIDSPDIQGTLAANKLVGSNTLTVKLGTLVGFQAFAYHHDSTNIDNAGPIPPEVGEKTQYTLHFKISNPANEISSGKMVATLPSYMRFTGTKLPEDATVEYKDRTNELVWMVGSMSPGMSRELRAQVEFTPARTQVDQNFLMFSQAVFTASDTFAKQNISLSLGEKNSFLPEDTNLGADASKVVKRGD